MPEQHTLKVRDLSEQDTYKDMTRIHWRDREGIENGAFIRLRKNSGDAVILVARGADEKIQGAIALDHLVRGKLSVELDGEYDFTYEKANSWDKLKWALRSSDPTARVATWIAIMSGIIGALGLVLAVIGLYPIFFNKTCEPTQATVRPSTATTGPATQFPRQRTLVIHE